MNRAVFLALFVLLLCGPPLSAQRGRANPTPPPSNSGAHPDTSDNDIQVFRRAVELQASQDQTSQYRAMFRKTESARLQMERMAESTNGVNAGSSASQSEGERSQIELVTLALDEMQQGDNEFLGSFSDPQKSGLKKFTRATRKAEADAFRFGKKLTKEMARPRVDSQGIIGLAAQARDALSALEVEQKKLGAEMGIDVSAPVPVATPALVPR